MPRGIPNKRRGRRAAAEENEDSAGEVPTLIPPSGEVPTATGGGLGGAIEAVRAALEPYDEATRKKVIRAVSVMLR